MYADIFLTTNIQLAGAERQKGNAQTARYL